MMFKAFIASTYPRVPMTKVLSDASAILRKSPGEPRRTPSTASVAPRSSTHKPQFGCDDFVGVLGPGKGHWVCIDVVEEVVDGVFEFLEGSEHAALEALFGEFSKESFDGIEPGG